jgi:fatty acid-binding protein DegV
MVSVGGVSAPYGTPLVAAQQMEGLDIPVVDSCSALMAEGSPALEGTGSPKAGTTAQEVIYRVRELIPRVHLFLTMDMLGYLGRTGRIGVAQALLASAIRIRPTILIPTDEDMVEPLDRSLSRSCALRGLVGHMARVVCERPVHAVAQQEGPIQKRWSF